MSAFNTNTTVPVVPVTSTTTLPNPALAQPGLVQQPGLAGTNTTGKAPLFDTNILNTNALNSGQMTREQRKALKAQHKAERQAVKGHTTKDQRKAMKIQHKAQRQALKHGHRGAPGMTGTGMPLTGGAMGTTGFVQPAATNIIQHAPIIEREVVVTHPVEVRREHHVQPIIHEREVQIQPIIQTQVTTERKVINTERDVLLAPIVEQPVAVGVAQPLMADQRTLHSTPMTGTGLNTSGGAQPHVGLGAKIKGSIKEASGKMTHNPAKVAEGQAIKSGQMPASGAAATSPRY